MLKYHHFTDLYSCHFRKWCRFVVTLLFFVLSNCYSAQSIAHTDSIGPKLTLMSGAQIISSDAQFNQQVANIGFKVKKAAKTVNNGSEVILIISAQSISVDDNSKQASAPRQKVIKRKAKNVTIVNVLAVTNANSKKYNFQNKSSHSHTFSRNSGDRVFLILNNLNKHYADALTVESVFYIKRVLSDLHLSICLQYNNRAYEYGFSAFYSVRPPPSV